MNEYSKPTRGQVSPANLRSGLLRRTSSPQRRSDAVQDLKRAREQRLSLPPDVAHHPARGLRICLGWLRLFQTIVSKVIALPHDSVAKAPIAHPRRNFKSLTFTKNATCGGTATLLPEGAAFLRDELPFMAGDTIFCTFRIQ
jgi:hypothetical protein